MVQTIEYFHSPNSLDVYVKGQIDWHQHVLKEIVSQYRKHCEAIKWKL